MKHTVYRFLTSGYITVNKQLANNLGLYESIVLSELISKCDYFESRQELDNEGYFYCTIQDLQEATTLTPKQQKATIDRLESLYLVKTKLKGVPAKRFFLIADEQKDALETLFFSLAKNAKQDNQKVPNKIGKKYQTTMVENAKQDRQKVRNIYKHKDKPNNEKEKEDALSQNLPLETSFEVKKGALGEFGLPNIALDAEMEALELLSNEILKFLGNNVTEKMRSNFRRIMRENGILRIDLQKQFEAYKEYISVTGTFKHTGFASFLDAIVEKDYDALLTDAKKKQKGIEPQPNVVLTVNEKLKRNQNLG